MLYMSGIILAQISHFFFAVITHFCNASKPYCEYEDMTYHKKTSAIRGTRECGETLKDLGTLWGKGILKASYILLLLLINFSSGNPYLYYFVLHRSYLYLYIGKTLPHT